MAVIDAYGNQVPPSAPTYVAWIETIGGQRTYHYAANPDYNPSAGQVSSPASVPPHLQFTFDTIGQVIFRSIGNCRLPLRPIWIQGVNASGDTNDRTHVLTNTLETLAGNDVLAFAIDAVFNWVGSSLSAGNGAIPDGTTVTAASTTVVGENSSLKMSAAATADMPGGTVITFKTPLTTITGAYALCAPLDPTEFGSLVALYDGSNLIFTASGGVTPPIGWSAADAAMLVNSLSNITFYPGDEKQLPDPLIVADKGAAATNAFRGIRYVIIPDYPASKGMPNFSAEYNRSNPGKSKDVTAVEFGAGSG